MIKEILEFTSQHFNKSVFEIADLFNNDWNFSDYYTASAIIQKVNPSVTKESPFMYEIILITGVDINIYLWRMIKKTDIGTTIVIDEEFFPMEKEIIISEVFINNTSSAYINNSINIEIIKNLNKILEDEVNKRGLTVDMYTINKIADITSYFNAIHNLNVSYIGRKNYLSENNEDSFVEVFQIDWNHSLFPQSVFIGLEYIWDSELTTYIPNGKFRPLIKVVENKNIYTKYKIN